jgi:hypothetical protein
MLSKAKHPYRDPNARQGHPRKTILLATVPVPRVVLMTPGCSRIQAIPLGALPCGTLPSMSSLADPMGLTRPQKPAELQGT